MKYWSRSVNTIISDGTKLTLLEDNSHVQRCLWWNVIKTWTWQYFFTPLLLYSSCSTWSHFLSISLSNSSDGHLPLQPHPLFGFGQARLFAMRPKYIRTLIIVIIKQIISCKFLTQQPTQTQTKLLINIIIDITVRYRLLMIHNKYCSCSLKTV